MSLPTSPTGWLALYRSPEQAERKDPGKYRPIDGWSPDGTALAVDEAAGRRVPASSLPHFRCLQESESEPAGVVPGQGWAVGYSVAGAPEAVIAWAVDRHGYAVPICATSEGYAEPFEQSEGTFLIPPGFTDETSPYLDPSP
jgi:hypothetical protein